MQSVKHLVCAIGAIGVTVIPLPSLSQTCNDPIPDRLNGQGMIDCLRVLSQQVKVLSSAMKGAVVAFDLTDCPNGWKPYTRAQGRLVVGIGNDNGNNHAEDGRILKEKKLRETGGREQVTLTTKELPPHTHPIHGTSHERTPKTYDTTQDEYGAYIENRTHTGSVGDGSAFSVLNPYVALNYCVKE